MHTCAACTIHGCSDVSNSKVPTNCPMRDEARMGEALALYEEGDKRAFFRAASAIEAEGYCRWPRLRETIELCRKMHYTRVGLAFCMGLRREALVLQRLLTQAGLQVHSIICKAGGTDKTSVGIAEGEKVRPGGFEAMCNPIAQALLLNDAGTQLNIVVGLCVGHDSLFYKYADAYTTTLVVKDRVLAHNPVGAIYCSEGYFADRLKPSDE